MLSLVFDELAMFMASLSHKKTGHPFGKARSCERTDLVTIMSFGNPAVPCFRDPWLSLHLCFRWTTPPYDGCGVSALFMFPILKQDSYQKSIKFKTPFKRIMVRRLMVEIVS